MNDQDPLADVLASAVEVKAKLFVMAGPMLNDAQMFERFGLTPSQLADRRQRCDLLALDREGRWCYPIFQFNDDGSLIHRLSEYLEFYRFDSPWGLLDLLLAEGSHHGMSILRAMQTQRDDILDRELAQESGDGFA